MATSRLLLLQLDLSDMIIRTASGGIPPGAKVLESKQTEETKMKNIKTKLSAWIALLTVCMLPISGRAAGHLMSGVRGLVESPNWFVEVLSESNHTVFYVQTELSGSFKVDLPPGNYVLTPITILSFPPTPPGLPHPNIAGVEIRGPSKAVTVKTIGYTIVQLATEPNDLPKGPL